MLGLFSLQGTCLRDVYDILCNSEDGKEIRKLVLEAAQDDVVRQFFEEEINGYRPDELGPPKNKLSKLLLSHTTVSLMLSQPSSRFNFHRIMDNGMILLADLSPRLGKEGAQTIGGFMVALMYISAMSRSDLPREQRRPFHMYLDEAPKLVTDTFEEIITEAPKHGVSLTIAHQFLRQFDIKKIDALGSVGTTIVFNVDSRDANYLLKDFKKKVKIDDFINLEQGEAVVRCGTEVAKIKTMDPLKIPKNNSKNRIIAESRGKYCMTASEVRRIIAGFVAHLYDMTATTVWMLADPLDEAIWLLEAGYQSAVYGTGYIAALLDAHDQAEGGIQTVLTGMAESIKGIKRQEYTTAVFARCLHGCSWHLRCEIARVLLEDYRAFIPERLGKCAPTQLADEIPALVLMLISSDSVLHQVAFSGVA